MGNSEHHRYDRGSKLAASLLGIIALVVPSIVVDLVALADPWELILYLALMLATLLGGTLWLVPSRRLSEVS